MCNRFGSHTILTNHSPAPSNGSYLGVVWQPTLHETTVEPPRGKFHQFFLRAFLFFYKVPPQRRCASQRKPHLCQTPIPPFRMKMTFYACDTSSVLQSKTSRFLNDVFIYTVWSSISYECTRKCIVPLQLCSRPGKT